MSRKIVFIGAGGHNFAYSLARDLLSYPAFDDCTLGLVDIDAKGLEVSRAAIQRIIDEGQYHAKIVASTDRTELLPGADGVVSMLMAQPLSVFRRDLEICEKYGVSINVGDTRNAAGVFRFLRTVPVMLDILNDIRRLCPNAVFLNYTNPMAMLCRAMQEAAPEIVTTGLCHSVQGTAAKFEKLLNIPQGELNYVCAGINHMAYYLRLEHNGRDVYPDLRHAILDDPEEFGRDIVRNEVFRAFGYYVTESSGHFSEYAPWFRKNPAKIEQYCMSGEGNTGRPNYTIEVREERARSYEAHVRHLMTDPVDLTRGRGYASRIFNAILGDGEMFRFNGNVRNFGLIDNLPDGACVEVPVLAAPGGLSPIHVGPVPYAVLPLMSLSSQIEEMAVRASFEGDAELVYQAICYDPLTAAVLDLREIRALTDELFAFSKPYLPQFRLK